MIAWRRTSLGRTKSTRSHRAFAWLLACLVLAGLVSLRVRAARTPSDSGTSRVVELRLDGAILPLPAEYIAGGIDQAARTNASLVLITMDTPGGLDSSMRDIIQRIITSPVPVVVYVAPSGSRAASAGFFILLSADVAAMAPGTDTGASSPIFVIGGSPVNIDDTLRRKATNEAAAYLRSITEKRGRNTALAEKAVTEAKAFSEKEALEGKLIDLVAPSTEELLAKLDGRVITRFDGSRLTLALKNPARAPLGMTARQRWLARIAQPDMLFILFIVGILGLYAEFSHPGLIFPGVIGAVCLVLALVAMQVLPVNAIGVLLILLAVGLFILEAKLTSHGALGLAGALAMILGALFLIRSPLTGAGVSLSTAVGVTAPFALVTIYLMRLVLRSFRWKPATGTEQMIGAAGEVTQAIETSGRGQVFVHGELWRAVAREGIAKGARVRVVRVDGLTLHVEPVEKEPGQPS